MWSPNSEQKFKKVCHDHPSLVATTTFLLVATTTFSWLPQPLFRGCHEHFFVVATNVLRIVGITICNNKNLYSVYSFIRLLNGLLAAACGHARQRHDALEFAWSPQDFACLIRRRTSHCRRLPMPSTTCRCSVKYRCIERHNLKSCTTRLTRVRGTCIGTLRLAAPSLPKVKSHRVSVHHRKTPVINITIAHFNNFTLCQSLYDCDPTIDDRRAAVAADFESNNWHSQRIGTEKQI